MNIYCARLEHSGHKDSSWLIILHLFSYKIYLGLANQVAAFHYTSIDQGPSRP